MTSTSYQTPATENSPKHDGAFTLKIGTPEEVRHRAIAASQKRTVTQIQQIMKQAEKLETEDYDTNFLVVILKKVGPSQKGGKSTYTKHIYGKGLLLDNFEENKPVLDSFKIKESRQIQKKFSVIKPVIPSRFSHTVQTVGTGARLAESELEVITHPEQTELHSKPKKRKISNNKEQKSKVRRKSIPNEKDKKKQQENLRSPVPATLSTIEDFEMEAETTDSGFAQEIAICCSCKESLAGRAPYLLTCFHGICGQCCDSLGEGEGQADQRLKCPVCEIVSLRHELIANKFVKTALPAVSANNENSQSQSEEKVCTGCEESVPATSFCVECQEYLCDQCVQAHRRVKITKEHNVQLKENAPAPSAAPSATDDDLMCHVHPKEPLKLFCETCDKLTCRDCQLTDHKDHKYYFVEEAGIKMRSVLTKLLEKMRDKKTYIEKSKSLISSRRSEIQECQHKVSNDIKNFAMKMISEVNKRGKNIMEDLTSLCNAKKHQLDQKGSDLSNVSKKLDHALQFVEYCTEKGTPEALLYSKRVLVKHLKEILQARCDVPNPNHKLDIRFNWDGNFASNLIPKQGILLVDGINYEGLSKAAQHNLVQGNAFQSQPSHSGMSGGQYMSLTREQQQAVMMKTRQQYVQQQQQQRGFMQSSLHSPITPPASAMGGPNVFGGGGPSQQHQGRMMGGYHPSQYNKPPQSAAISSSDPMSRGRQGMPSPYQNMGNHPSTSTGHFPTPHMQPHSMQQANSLQQQSAYQNRLFTLAELQEQRVMMRKQQGPPPTGAPPPSPIVIAPEGEEHSTHLMPPMSQRANAPLPGSMGSTSRPNTTSPHGSNTSSPAHVGSTTSNSPEQRPRSRTMETESSTNSKSRMKGESSERPSCSFSTSPKPSQVDKQDKNRGQLSINDFTFDQDPMSFIKNINQEIDLNPEKTLGLLSTGHQNQSSNEAVSKSQSRPSASSMSIGKSPRSVESERTDVVGSTGTVASGKDRSHLPPMINSQESDPNEDWCAVCNNGGDLLCCDECPKVFHLRCHVPTIKQSPSGHWSCNMCKKVEDLRLDKPDPKDNHLITSSGGTKRKHPSGLTDKELKVCQRILLELFAQESSMPFHEPVSKTVPNYYKIITYPMDYSTIKSKLRRSNVNHYSSVEDFLMDVQIVFTNCARYNSADSEMGVIGKKMEAFFHSLVRQFLPYIDIQPVTSSGSNASTASTSTTTVSNLGGAGGDVASTANVTSSTATAATVTSVLVGAKGDGKSEGSSSTEEDRNCAPPKAKLKKTVSIEESSLNSGSSDKEDDLNSSSGSHKENKSEGRQKLKLKLKTSYKLVTYDEQEENRENNTTTITSDNNEREEEEESTTTPSTENITATVEENNKSPIGVTKSPSVLTNSAGDGANETDATVNDEESTIGGKESTANDVTNNDIDEALPMDTSEDNSSIAVDTTAVATSSPIVATAKPVENHSQISTELSESSILDELPDLGGDETESLEGLDDDDIKSKDACLNDSDFVPSLELDLTDSEKTPDKAPTLEML